ncbi:RusA family crossover junction endodeoxyribonuclease [Kitasatospora sp. NPDC052868]|uniref:RusA family crossover junction endodeoxyribonuclease n=1 Tax=Kitasatospora sp. NPDC052868 TaxID=3364060 RepID=UPI0037CA2BF7
MTAAAAPPAGGAAPAREPALTVTVYGDPAAQGSKAYKGHRTSRVTGRQVAVLAEQSKMVKPWRALVTAAAVRAIAGTRAAARADAAPGSGSPPAAPLAGPLAVAVVFTMPRPGRIPGDRLGWPAVRPDGDKLLRAVFDGLTDARAWGDDGQVVQWSGIKVYPGLHPLALPVPGAHIRIWQVAATPATHTPGGEQ